MANLVLDNSSGNMAVIVESFTNSLSKSIEKQTPQYKVKEVLVFNTDTPIFRILDNGSVFISRKTLVDCLSDPYFQTQIVHTELLHHLLRSRFRVESYASLLPMWFHFTTIHMGHKRILTIKEDFTKPLSREDLERARTLTKDRGSAWSNIDYEYLRKYLAKHPCTEPQGSNLYSLSLNSRYRNI